MSASVGVDDYSGDRGSVVFQVFADGTLVADSRTMTGSTATKVVNATVSGAQTLRLVGTDAGDGINHDHADWATPRSPAPDHSLVPVAENESATGSPHSGAVNLYRASTAPLTPNEAVLTEE